MSHESGVVENGDFQYFRSPNLPNSDKKCVIGFSLTLKRMTLNDLEVPFSVKICFQRLFGWILLPRFLRQHYCVRTDEDTPILPATNMFAGEASF